MAAPATVPAQEGEINRVFNEEQTAVTAGEGRVPSLMTEIKPPLGAP